MSHKQLENLFSFLDNLFLRLAELGVEISKYKMDHVGYQCSSDADYDKCKESFLNLGELIDENIVGDRRVGLFKLNKPIDYRNYRINAIEVIAPKKGQVCPSALEHAEFVLDEKFNEFMARYPSTKWDTSAVDHPMFPMVKLRLGEHIQAKFHYEHVFDISDRKKKDNNSLGDKNEKS